MKAFSDGKLTNRRTIRSDDTQIPQKDDEGLDLPPWNPEELHQTQALIQDLDKQFASLREILHNRATHLSGAKRTLSELQTLLFPPRRPWWRKWLPW